MAKSPVEYESRRCTCAGKEDQPAQSPRGPGPCDTRINARQATATPCSGNFSREWRERGKRHSANKNCESTAYDPFLLDLLKTRPVVRAASRNWVVGLRRGGALRRVQRQKVLKKLPWEKLASGT